MSSPSHRPPPKPPPGWQNTTDIPLTFVYDPYQERFCYYVIAQGKAIFIYNRLVIVGIAVVWVIVHTVDFSYQIMRTLVRYLRMLAWWMLAISAKLKPAICISNGGAMTLGQALLSPASFWVLGEHKGGKKARSGITHRLGCNSGQHLVIPHRRGAVYQQSQRSEINPPRHQGDRKTPKHSDVLMSTIGRVLSVMRDIFRLEEFQGFRGKKELDVTQFEMLRRANLQRPPSSQP